MAEKLSRRFQVLPLSGHCAECQVTITEDVQRVSDLHASTTGHEVRVTETRLTIIRRQEPEAAHG